MSHTSAAQGVSETSTAAPTTGSAATAAAGGAGNVTTSTTISSLADLQQKAPQLYKIMMESIAMEICNQMQDSQNRLKQMWDEGNR